MSEAEVKMSDTAGLLALAMLKRSIIDRKDNKVIVTLKDELNAALLMEALDNLEEAADESPK